MITDYQYGTPSLEEWHGLWKSVASDADVTEEEFNITYKSLDEWLSMYGNNGVEADCDFFVVGDCQGDKTQCVELVNPNVLTADFLKYLQRWTKECHPSWRIVIPTFLGEHNVIVIYKDTIRANREYEHHLDNSLNIITDQMLLLDTYKYLKK